MRMAARSIHASISNWQSGHLNGSAASLCLYAKTSGLTDTGSLRGEGQIRQWMRRRTHHRHEIEREMSRNVCNGAAEILAHGRRVATSKQLGLDSSSE